MMKPPGKKDSPPGKRRRFKRIRVLLGLILLVSAVWLGLYLRSDAFQELVRKKIIAELELVTGGRVEIQALTFKLFSLQFETTGITIHGRENPNQAPLVHVDRITGQARIISLFRRSIGLRSLEISHPVVHLILYPDGTTNQPMPGVPAQGSGKNRDLQPLFDLAIDRLTIDSAELLVQDRKIPFDFVGSHLSGGMTYSATAKNYEGNLQIELTEARYQGFRPLHGQLELHFAMDPSRLELRTLKFTQNRSVLEASGSLTNYSHPEVHLQYSTSLDLLEFAHIAKIEELEGGHLDMKGTADYQNGSYQAQGGFTARSVTWRESGVLMAGVDVASPFLFTTEKISFSAIKARVMGGGAAGELQVFAGKLAPRGTIHLRLAGVQLSQLAAAISTRRLPLDRINLAGGISGDLNGAWTGSVKDLVAQAKLQVDPPANPLPQQLPVTAGLAATYHRRGPILEIADLNLATRGIHLEASGILGSSTSQLKMAFNASDLSGLQPVLAAWSADAQVPVEVHGRAAFDGAVFGTFDFISARGRVNLQDFDTFLGPVHSLLIPNPSGRIHWDSMLADVQISPFMVSAQNGVLKRGPAQMNFSGSATLDRGVFNAKTSDFNVNLQVQNGSVADVELFSGLSYPVSGVLNATVHATGTLQDLHGMGALSASKITIYGEPFTQFRSSVNFAGQETQFSDILLAHNGAQLTGSAMVNAAAGSFRFDLSGANIELANFSRFAPKRFSLAGRADFHASGSGTPAAPVMNAQLKVRQLVMNGDLVGDLTASAETHGENMLLRASTSFETAVFNLEGSMRLRDAYPAQITLRFDHLDFDPMIHAYLKAPITGHSTIQGYVQLSGPLKTPRDLSVVANITQLSADIEHIKLQNDGALRFSVNHQAIHVDQFHLTGPETDISLSGDANVSGQMLDVHAEGKMDLKLIQTVDPDLTSSGTATMEVHLAGTVNQPELRGRMDITNGAISAADLPNGLTQISGRLVFAQDRMQMEKLRAHSGGGDLDLSGFIAYRGGLFFDVTAIGNDVRVRYPPGLSASANAVFHYTGSAQGSLLSGNATIIRLALDPKFDFAQYLARGRTPGLTGKQNSFLENMRLDIHITSTPELSVETSLAKVAGDANLHIRGTVANPVLMGRVNIVQGNVSFNGAKYRLEHGDVTFSNPQTIQPIINVEMTARVRDYDITIGFHGPVDRLNITYRSDPPLASSDIIALLAFGRTKQEDVYSQNTTPLATSDTMLQQALTTASSSRVQKLFGVGSVKIDPQAIDPENNIGPRVTIEQQIQNNITLTYLTNVAQSSSEQVIQLEYNLTKSISVVAVRDQNGILSFEVKIKKRKR